MQQISGFLDFWFSGVAVGSIKSEASEWLFCTLVPFHVETLCSKIPNQKISTVTPMVL
jgi:hypothetical protein